jgi:hypothetical protein
VGVVTYRPEPFVTKVSKRYLPRGDAYEGMHGRLKEIAAGYRRGR